MTDDHKAEPLDLDALERDVQGTPQHRFIKVRVLALISELRTARSALADAWDEGCKFGYDYGRIEGRDDCAYAVPTANPYIDRTGGTS